MNTSLRIAADRHLNTGKQYKLVIVSSRNISNRKNLSGTSFYIKKALEEFVGDVEVIDRLRLESNSLKSIIYNSGFYWRYGIVRIKQMFWKLFSRKYQYDRTSLISRYYAKKIQERLKGKKYDFIIVDKGSIEVAYLKTHIPIIYISDAVFKLMVDFYPGFFNLAPSAVREGNLLEQKAIHNASLCIYRSKWAANSAIRDYGANADKVKVIYHGPNLESSYLPAYEEVIGKKQTKECNLLLIGVDWQRKGCNIAVETVEILNKMDINARLTICGCAPPSDMILSKYVTIIPYLDKNKKEDMEKMISLYKDATYFILPTRAETFGFVFVEAFSFGVPVCATNVGGITEIVKDKENGYVFSLEDNGEKYAEKIASNFKDPHEYKRMSLNAYTMYSQECNWKQWAMSLKELMEKIT